MTIYNEHVIKMLLQTNDNDAVCKEIFLADIYYKPVNKGLCA